MPTIFDRLNEKTLYIFGAVNALSIVAVWALYPESNQRTLEEMDLVFASDSIWVWDAEKNFAKLKDENPELIKTAKSGHRASDAEKGVIGSRRASRASTSARKASLTVAGDEKANVSHE